MRDLLLQCAGVAGIVVALIHGVLGETKVFARATITPESLRMLIRSPAAGRSTGMAAPAGQGTSVLDRWRSRTISERPPPYHEAVVLVGDARQPRDGASAPAVLQAEMLLASGKWFRALLCRGRSKRTRPGQGDGTRERCKLMPSRNQETSWRRVMQLRDPELPSTKAKVRASGLSRPGLEQQPA
ncbi:hypothetical protein ACU4GH_13220 [Bradyrhizobium betae]